MTTYDDCLLPAQDELERAAFAGDPDARFKLAKYKMDGIGREADLSGAMELFDRLAVVERRADAQYFLGLCYLELSNQEDKILNLERAFDWYYQSAKQGYALAQFMVGVCYEYGCGTVGQKQYPQAAVKWYKLAAAQNYELAQKALDRMADQTAPKQEPVLEIQAQEQPVRRDKIFSFSRPRKPSPALEPGVAQA